MAGEGDGESRSSRSASGSRPSSPTSTLPSSRCAGCPPTTCGALFARYSRYPGTLRRLLLDEFDADLDPPARAQGAGGGRAEALYERVLGEYGDDSVAQLAGVHVACEWVSNLLTKVIERPRLGAYLEQSTRYIAFDQPVPGLGYRYYRGPELGAEYERAMDALFEDYGLALQALQPWVAERFPPGEGQSPAAHERAVRAKALDLARGLLPAATLSHVGVFASGQTFERLVMHLRAEELPEAREAAELLLEALRTVVPAFMARVDRPDRGGAWTEFLRRRAAGEAEAVARLGLDRPTEEAPAGAEVRLLHADGEERLLLSALLFERASAGERQIIDAIDALAAEERAALLAELLSGRENRRHLPGRGLEALRYRFEIVSDYGAFRDLQRHRMLTAQWQSLGPDLGAELPEEVEAAGLAPLFEAAFERSRAAWQRLAEQRPRAAGRLPAVHGLPHPLRARHERARGDAPDRAALGARGPRLLPRDRCPHARADRDRAPGRRGGDEPPRRCRRAAPGADRGGAAWREQAHLGWPRWTCRRAF